MVAFPTTLTVPARFGVMSWSFSAWMRAWLADMLLSRSMLALELRGRLFGGSGEPSCVRDVLDVFDSRRVLAREVVDVLAAMLSMSLWNLRFVVASAGCVSVMLALRAARRLACATAKADVLEQLQLASDGAPAPLCGSLFTCSEVGRTKQE